MFIIRKPDFILPILYALDAKGCVQTWKVWTCGDTVYTQFGKEGGKLQTTVGKVCEPKNVGRVNGTSATMQARLEAMAMHKHRVERKYKMTREELAKSDSHGFLPMLAQDYWVRPKGKKAHVSPAGERLNFESGTDVIAQRKYNGLRCIARWDDEGRVLLTSRNGKQWRMPHLVKPLSAFMPSRVVLDGELYIHGVELQDLTSLARKYQPGSEKLEFRMYDMFSKDEPSLPQVERLAWLDRLFLQANVDPCIRRTPWNFLKFREGDEREGLRLLEQQYVQEGYEGLMLRSRDGVYRWGKVRSAELLKYKSFQDAEFVVVDVVEGKGKFTGCAVLECVNDRCECGSMTFVASDRWQNVRCRLCEKHMPRFRVSPRGKMPERKAMWERRKDIIGARYTVRFFDRFKDGLPQFPIGLAFRDARDL